MVRQTAKLIFFEVLGGMLFLAVIALSVVAWRLYQGPVELGAFKDDIERALTQARAGRGVALEQVQLEWSPETRRIDVTAAGLVFYDDLGTVAARADRADIRLDASELLFGEVEVLAMALDGGAVDLRQVSPSEWTFAGERLPPIPAGALPRNPAEGLAATDRVFKAILDGLPATLGGVQMEGVSFEDMDIDVYLLDGRQIMSLEGAEGAFARRDLDVDLRVSGFGASPNLPQGIAVDFSTDGSGERIRGNLALIGWSVDELAADIGIMPGRVTGLPADLAFNFEAERVGGLQGVSITAETGRGAVRLGETSVPVSRLTGRLDYATGEDIARLSLDVADAGPVRGGLELTMTDAVYGEGPSRAVTLRAPELTLDFRPLFPAAWPIANVDLGARVDFLAHSMTIDRLSAEVADASVRASGELRRHFDMAPGELPLSADLVAELDGAVGVETVLDFWPESLGRGARTFAAEKIEAGDVTQASLRLDLDPDSFAGGHLADEALELTFSAEGARVRFLEDVPPIDAASGTARLTGNSLGVDLARGRFGSWTVDDGEVLFPQFVPKGADFVVTAHGTGEVSEVVAAVFDSRLNLRERTGFDPERLSGKGELDFELRRPALRRVPEGATRFSVMGEVRDAGLEGVGAGFDLSAATARVDVDRERIDVSGFGQLGPATVTFNWRDDLNDGDAPTRLSARSTVTPDILNRFGLLGRPYLSGEIPVIVEAGLKGSEIVTADVDLDLTPARIDLAEIGWLKPPGARAEAQIGYVFSGAERRAQGRLDSETATLVGDLQLGTDGRLIALDIERAYLEGRADVSGELHRSADGGLSLSLTGPFLDISNAMPDLSALGSADAFRGALTLDAEVDRLLLGEELDLRAARLAAISTTDGLQSFTASGATEEGSPIEASYQTISPERADISIKSGNAGFLMAALFDTDFLRGGTLDLSGELRTDGAPSDVLLILRDVRMRDAPFLTQILSLASLRGLTDTLAGEGVLFTEVRAPIRIGGGRFVVAGGRASGPALGLTVNGWLAPADGGINLDGVLVPSYGVNSALGDIPIFGDLVVGREGEGIFSLTYAVRGTLEKAQVSVNPLSGVLPGVARRIFENPAQTELPLPEDPAPEPAPSE